MAAILVFGSFLAGSLISLLIPALLVITILAWHTRSIMRIPRDPAETAVHGAGAAEVEGRSDAGESAAQSNRP